MNPTASASHHARREQLDQPEPPGATGPRTPEGKQRSAANGWNNLPNPRSRRQIRIALVDVTGMAGKMTELRKLIAGVK